MAHTAHLTPEQRKTRRQMMALARQFEKGARVARQIGNPYAVEAERNARSLRCAASILLHKEH